MIGRLKGILVEKHPPEVLIEVAGVGYEVFMPMTCIYQLPKINEEVIIYTHFAVREDAQVLYGFNHRQERSLFKEIIKVSGIGPKLALAILSAVPAVTFIQAVQQNKMEMLLNIPGIGKKTAERLLIELRDRIKKLEISSTATLDIAIAETDASGYIQNNAAIEEAVAALISLGYRASEASKMVTKVYQSGMDSEALIRAALKQAI